MIDMGALNSEGQLMEQTFLKNYDNQKYVHM